MSEELPEFNVGDFVVVKDEPIYRNTVPRWEEMAGEPQRIIGTRSNGDIELLCRPGYWYMHDAWELAK